LQTALNMFATIRRYKLYGVQLKLLCEIASPTMDLLILWRQTPPVYLAQHVVLCITCMQLKNHIDSCYCPALHVWLVPRSSVGQMYDL
jgi:hypothetical protein